MIRCHNDLIVNCEEVQAQVKDNVSRKRTRIITAQLVFELAKLGSRPEKNNSIDARQSLLSFRSSNVVKWSYLIKI